MAYVLACIDLLVILALASIFADEFIYLGDGLRLRRVDVRRKLVFGGLIAAVAAVFAFVAASNRSLLSLELFSRFFEWFASLFPETEPAEGFPLSLSPQQIQNIEALRQLEELMQDQEPSRFWIALVRTIRTLIIAGALVGLAILVVGPFLSEEFSDRVRSARPLDAIMRRVRGFMRFFRRMFRLTRRWWRRLDLTVLRIPRPPKTRSEPDPPRQGLRKRRQVSRVSAKFLALIAWSTERGYTYRKSHVPTEYGRRLQAGFPALTQPIDTAIEVFEEAMYSDHVIAGSRMRAYDRAIDSIVKSGIPPANANSARSG